MGLNVTLLQELPKTPTSGLQLLTNLYRMLAPPARLHYATTAIGARRLGTVLQSSQLILPFESLTFLIGTRCLTSNYMCPSLIQLRNKEHSYIPTKSPHTAVKTWAPRCAFRIASVDVQFDGTSFCYFHGETGSMGQSDDVAA